MGCLPEHIKVDVELREPRDLQMAVHLARAYKRRTAAMPVAAAPRPAHSPQRPVLPPAPPRPALGALAASGALLALPAGQPRVFRRLTPAEQQEHRRLELCYNCDEPYVRGHQCQRLFYLEVDNYPENDMTVEVATAVAITADAPGAVAAPEPATVVTKPSMVSLHAITGIRGENAMLLPVAIHGHRLTALLDFGSRHNFIDAALMHRILLSTILHPTVRVLVANGDSVPCEGVARDVALTIGTKEFSISCFGINLGGFDVILGVDFLRTLRPILWDFEDLCMAFTRGSRRIL